MKNQFDNFYDAWWWLNSTIAFYNPEWGMHLNGEPLPVDNDYIAWASGFHRSIDVNVQKVNPDTNSIDNDMSKNTKVEIWLECGEAWYDEYCNCWSFSHNINYDCGGDTYEQAITNLANIVYQYYNTDVKIRKHRRYLESLMKKSRKYKKDKNNG